MSLKQKGSVQDYTAKFQNAAYAAEGHSDLTLRTFYYQGLKEEIKEALTYHEEPEELPGLIKLAMLMDRRRNERWFDKKSYNANTARPARPRHTQEGGDAMELDGTQRDEDKRNKKGKGKRPPRKERNDEQKARFNKGLCIYCGDKWEPKHRCPQRNNNGRSAAVASQEEPREASVATKEINYAQLSWTACYDDHCTTHQSDKDATG